MQQQWRIRIRGQQRKAIDVALVVQAVIALGRQLDAEKYPKSPDAPSTESAQKSAEELPS